MDKTTIHIMHTSHLDLFWMGSQETCLEWGARIIRDAARIAEEDKGFHFMIETVRFLEYIYKKYPEERAPFAKLFESGQFVVTAAYIDSIESAHDGESHVRNVVYGRKLAKELAALTPRTCFHPDLPGTAEQKPQILKKAGVDYYLGCRGFYHGARFNWKALDGSRIIYYNFPIHYGWFALDKDILDNLDKIRNAVASQNHIAVCMSSGDLGPVDAFSIPGDDRKTRVRVNLRNYIREIAEKYPDYTIKMDNIVQTLDGMGQTGLEDRDGENPSRWGNHCSALNLTRMELDKKLAAGLTDAEKLDAICRCLGIPTATIEFERHPLAHIGASKRHYFELDRNPETNQAWLEEAWRYLLITQDHNGGGVDGAQTLFDRFRYMEAGLQIAGKISRGALNGIAARVKSKGPGLLVFNTLNWPRDGYVEFENSALDPNKAYVAEDDAGKCVPVVRRNDRYAFVAPGIPSVGYKRFSFKVSSELWPGCEAVETTRGILLKNEYLSILVDRLTGAVLSITDLKTGKNLVAGRNFGTINAYQDDSDSVNDRVVDKPLVDESKSHVYKVSVLRSDPLGATVRIETEVLDSKIYCDISLEPGKREAVIDVTHFWAGIAHKQIKMNLDLECKGELYYGVPYGTQKKGRPLEGGLIFKADEISDELYKRYREVEKWFAIQGENSGILVASNHSAYEYLENGILALLNRTVHNCGDHDVICTDTGIHRYRYVIVPYEGSWSDGAYRRGWELMFPMYSAEPAAEAREGRGSPPDAALEGERSFLESSGILTVFKESGGKYELRLFDSSGKTGGTGLRNTLGLRNLGVTDLEHNPIGDPLETLKAYEIKTIVCDGQGG